MVLSLFLATLVASFSLVLSDANDCGQWHTCAECIQNNPCGWCAENVTFSDGTIGPHCAGKPTDPNNPPPGYKPWTCAKDYQNIACYGYVCEKDHFQCLSSGRAGGGVPLEECMKTCFPPTFDCNRTNYTCYQTTPGHGTDKPSCERACVPLPPPSQPAPPPPTPPPPPPGFECTPDSVICVPGKNGSGIPKPDCDAACLKNVTPVFLIGDWRGLQISQGFVKGEWQMRVTETSAIILDSNKNFWARGMVYIKLSELWLETADGVKRGIFALNTLPEVEMLTWGMSDFGAPPPLSFDEAMQAKDLFVWSKCIKPNICKFNIISILSKLKNHNNMNLHNLLQNYDEEDHSGKRALNQRPVDDPCSKYPDCPTCINAKDNCGWCTVPVIYNTTDGPVIGKNCAGVNTTISPRINCTGSFSTVDCKFPTTTTTSSTTSNPTPVPNDKYYCDPVHLACVLSNNGTEPKEVCDAQCTSNPFVPPDLQNRFFRGLQIDMKYIQGEYQVKFGTRDVVIVSATGVSYHGLVFSVQKYIVIKFDDGNTIYSLWQLEYGPATLYLSWAWGAPNGNPPANFDEAMTSAGQQSFWFVSCLDGKPKTICNFEQAAE